MSKKKSKKGKDSKFFSSNTKKGEIREILDELCNPKLDVQRDAIKRVIALMTVGKDVSMLFPQVVNCMQTSKYLLYPQSKSTMMVLTPCSVGFNAQVSNKPTNKSSLKDLPLYLKCRSPCLVSYSAPLCCSCLPLLLFTRPVNRNVNRNRSNVIPTKTFPTCRNSKYK